MSTDLTRPAEPYDADAVVRYLNLNPNDPKTAAILAVCRRYALDPLLKHVTLIPKSGVYITRDGLLHVAHRSGVFDGLVVEEDPHVVDGEWKCRVSVYRKDMGRPFTFPGRYPTRGGNERYAQEMALKVAEAHALRRAFDVSGLGIQEEMEAGAVPAAQQVVRQAPQQRQERPAADRPAPTPETTTDAPQGVPDDVAEHMTRHALTVADMALTIGDADRVRQTYQDARERDYGTGPGAILRVDVYRALKFADLEPLGIPDDVERVELGALLIAVGKRLSAGQGPVRVAAADAAEGDGEDVVDAEVVDEPARPSPQGVEQPPVEVDPWADGGGTAQAAQEARREPKADPHGLRAAIRNGGVQDAEEGVRGDGWDKDEPPF